MRTVYEEHGFTWDESGYHGDLDDVVGSFEAFWVAEEDGARGVVGCAGLRLGEVVLPGSDCSLERLYVTPAARGGGVGTALVAAVVDEARRRGCTQLEIWSDRRFEDAHRLYHRLGACLVSERVAADPDRSPEWGFVIRL